MRQAQNAAAYFSLCTLHSAELALIDAPVQDIGPLMADFKTHGLEFIHGFNQSAGYRITRSELNLVHAISLDNAGHFMLDDRADTAAFSASHRGLLESTYNHSVDVLFSGARALSINSPAPFAIGNNANFSFAANQADSDFKLALDYAANNITITVNGMMSKKAMVKLDAANAVRRFYVDAEISVTRININLINGHAGTGNDGRIAADNFVFNNAIAGNKSTGGVLFLTIVFAPVLTPDFCLPAPVFINNKNNIVEAITLRCA